MSVGQKIWRGITIVDRYLGVIFLFNLIILILIDTCLRAFAITPFMGTMELVRCFLIWSVFVSLRQVTKEDGHIRMGELIALAPPIWQQIIKLAIHLAALLVFLSLHFRSSRLRCTIFMIPPQPWRFRW